ncbi:hypothetical protein MIR68_004482 [Amoeboaphelidium protococcarum]|nr:hypothetical protein MIR68_004482 [Amoeboaphelidium protococcarum]
MKQERKSSCKRQAQLQIEEYQNERSRQNNLTLDQNGAIDVVVKEKNAFITGYVGSGKSAVVNAIRRHIDSDRRSKFNYRVLAATNSAAKRVNEHTLHRTFGILHGSTPFSLMFGRAPNGFANYADVSDVSFTDDDFAKLKERWTQLVDVILLVQSLMKDFKQA